ncbi:Hypothetical predicted protein [Marmota monax]|uniref:Uncharacterized protein n=1 Tax=Marmota monax TaxID=9995 RepID=A0A5E4AKF2_MARMO|nr:Hypothetical predicted protein [Marmota monax]
MHRLPVPPPLPPAHTEDEKYLSLQMVLGGHVALEPSCYVPVSDATTRLGTGQQQGPKLECHQIHPPRSLLNAALPGQAAHWPHPPHSPAPSAIPLTANNPAIHCPRDLTDNQLTTLPLAGLGGLMHLKLKGNLALSQAFSKDSFPRLR